MVLVVDDNRDAADTLGALIRFKGHRASVAYDADTGFRMAERSVPDIILHDIAMPIVDGYAAARRLRSEAQFLKTLLVAVTAHNTPSDRQLSKEAGYDLHLAKPVDFEALDEILNRRVANADA